MSEPTVSFYPVKRVIAFLIIALLGMAALCVILPPRSRWIYDIREVMSWFCFLYFALVASLFVEQLFIRGPAIEVSREGIRDVSFSPDLIPWSAVDSINRYSQFVVMLHMNKDIRKKFKRTWRRKIYDAGVSIFSNRRSVQIGMLGLSGWASDLLAAVEQFAPAHVVLQNYKRSAPVVEAPGTPADPNDPDYWLRNPPADARVECYKDRRVVTLKDGRVVAELMTGRGRWFTSFEEFRDFIGD
jgi:hypothetical protein